jgi:hypothetical protein
MQAHSYLFSSRGVDSNRHKTRYFSKHSQLRSKKGQLKRVPKIILQEKTRIIPSVLIKIQQESVLEEKAQV